MSRTTNMFESLETRRLMSNTLSAGLLHIEGTSVADTVSVYLSAAGDKVVVAHNGVTQSFWKSQVNRLAIGAGGGNNVIAVSPNLTLPATIACGSGNDIISGGSGAETVYGGDGRDTFSGNGGNDSCFGEGGNDIFYGGDGADMFNAGAGNDSAYGGNHNDYLFGDLGADTLNGDGGNDTIVGGDSNDSLFGGAGNDYMRGNRGIDALCGDAGADKLYGDEDSDNLIGGTEVDSMWGGAGDDFLNSWGDGVDDFVYGEAGRDTAHFDDQPWYAPWEADDTTSSIEVLHPY